MPEIVDSTRFHVYNAPGSSYFPYPAYFRDLDTATHRLAANFNELDQEFAALGRDLRSFAKDVHRLGLRYHVGKTLLETQAAS